MGFKIGLACVCLVAASWLAAGCGQPNNEEVSGTYKQLSPADAKKRLDETMARRNGKMAPGQVSGGK